MASKKKERRISPYFVFIHNDEKDDFCVGLLLLFVLYLEKRGRIEWTEGDRNRKIKKEEKKKKSLEIARPRPHAPTFNNSFLFFLSLAFEEKSICRPIFPLLPIQDPPTFPEKKEENKP
jgi:hypothetical protein